MPSKYFIPGHSLSLKSDKQNSVPTFAQWDAIIDGDKIQILNNYPNWDFNIEDIGSTNLDDLNMGEGFKKYNFQNAANNIFNLYYGKKTYLEDFLLLSPIFLDKKHNNVTNFLGSITGEVRALCFYRLAEIFLRLLDLYKDNFGTTWQLRTVRILLLRQRFRYLSSLYYCDANKKKISGYEGVFKAAHHEYADVFLNEQDEFQLAFAVMEHNGKPWNLDHEAELLVFDQKDPQDQNQIWPFVLHDNVSQTWIDLILRKWFLAHNDIMRTNRILGGLVNDLVPVASNTSKKNSKSGINNSKGIRFAAVYQLLPLLFGFSAYPALFFLFKGWKQGLVVCGAIGLLLPLLGTIFFMIRYKGLFPNQLLYPFALRIPAMSMVGVFGVIGLVDPLVEFSYNCFNEQTVLIALVIILAALLLSFLYIFFEVVLRTRKREGSLQRSVYIFMYGYGTALWISIFISWVSIATGIINKNAGPVVRGIDLFGFSISFDFAIFISALALLFGIFTQLFWEEKSISEPL